MTNISKMLLVASFPESILTFRGALIDSVLAEGVEVDVAAPGLAERSPVRRALESKGVAVHHVPLQRTGSNPLVDMMSLWRLYRLMRKSRPDMVLSYTIKPVIYGSIAAWLAQISHRYVLITGLGYVFTGERRGMMQVFARRLYRFALGKVDGVFFQNRDDRNLFLDEGIVSARMPSVVLRGSGVDLNAFAVKPIPDNPVRFLMICRLQGDKGVREYVQAAKQTRIRHPEARFGLVGWIDENPDAVSQDELDAWVKQGSIEFMGRLDDVRPAIADSSVYVLPSYREGTPRTVLEAMAMGRAVITTDAPGCRETVIDGENGFLVSTQSADELQIAMQKFIDDPSLIRSMGNRSREIAEEKYDVHKVNALMLREMGIT